LLKELDRTPSWRSLNKMAPDSNYRFAMQEMILRMFAFHEIIDAYNGNLAKFLNDYMNIHRNDDAVFLETKRVLFVQTIDFIWEKIFSKTAPPKLTVTVLEALLVGVSSNLTHLHGIDAQRARAAYEKLLLEEEFSNITTIREGLSKKPRVLGRIGAAIRVFREA
jgi:hypothetical protein